MTTGTVSLSCISVLRQTPQSTCSVCFHQAHGDLNTGHASPLEFSSVDSTSLVTSVVVQEMGVRFSRPSPGCLALPYKEYVKEVF